MLRHTENEFEDQKKLTRDLLKKRKVCDSKRELKTFFSKHNEYD